MRGNIYLILFLFIFVVLIQNAEAIDITSCGNITSSGTYQLTNDINGNRTCISIESSNVVLNCNGNQIYYNFTEPFVNQSPIKVHKDGTIINNITVVGCRIMVDANLTWTTGIFVHEADDVSIKNNYVGIYTLGAFVTGIMVSNSHRPNVTDNWVLIGSDLSSVHPRPTAYGVRFYYVFDGTLYGTHLDMDSPDPNLYGGVFITDTFNTDISHNYFEVEGLRGFNFGLGVYRSSNIRSLNNKYKLRWTNIYSIYSEYNNRNALVSENDIVETNVMANWWLYPRQSIIILRNVTFENYHGSINFPGEINVTDKRVEKSNLNISENRAFVSSVLLPEMNKSATIVLRHLGTTPPVFIEADYRDFGTYEYCPAPVCTVINSSYAMATFNVSHFTSYRVVQLRCLLCGDVNLDGRVNILDALIDARIYRQLITPSVFQQICGDVNIDRNIDMSDAMLIARYASGYPVTLRCI